MARRRRRSANDPLKLARARFSELGILVPAATRARVTMLHALVVVLCTFLAFAGAILGMFVSMLVGSQTHGIVTVTLLVPTVWLPFWVAQRISRAGLLALYTRAIGQLESPHATSGAVAAGSSVAISTRGRDDGQLP